MWLRQVYKPAAAEAELDTGRQSQVIASVPGAGPISESDVDPGSVWKRYINVFLGGPLLPGKR